MASYIQGIACAICIISIVGIFLGLLLAFTTLFTVLMQLRYPVTKVTCPICQRKLNVEVDVQKFHCPCHTCLEKHGDQWGEC
ncbi:hypothetical protein EDD58_10234 [Hazenella coriacea]|uniref:Uncharacterized protein n=2 Tax=Hazenella coriacea TaxID=1179467 RepID=A0A4R3LAZ9_9BACL|nr:hypothetical protein EDD58_10234 [Hazenella coriacea]